MGSALKQTREDAGISLDQAARHLRIPPGYLLQIEKGERSVSTPRAMQIAEYYEKEKDELFVPTRYSARQRRGG